MLHNLPEGLHSLHVNQVPVQVSIQAPNALHMPASAVAQCGTAIQTQHIVAEVSDIIRAFEVEWAPRWQRHQNDSDAQWEPILAS